MSSNRWYISIQNVCSHKDNIPIKGIYHAWGSNDGELIAPTELLLEKERGPTALHPSVSKNRLQYAASMSKEISDCCKMS